MTGSSAIAQPASTRHFRVLDGLRGVAAVAVVAYHFAGRADLPSLMPRGYLAVDFFFVLSGFVLAHAYLRRLRETLSTSRFLLQRWIRLWPMLLPGTLLGAVMEVWRPGGGDPAAHAAQVAAATVLGSMAVPLPWQTTMEKTIFPINGPVWSLFFEVVANVVFVLVAKSQHLRLAAAALTAFGGVGFLIWATASGTADIGPYLDNWTGGFPRVAYSFFAGVLISAYAPRGIALPAWIYPPVLLAVMMVPIMHGAIDVAIDLGAILVLFPVIVCSATRSRTGAIMGRLCGFAGELSYPLYAIHYPVIRAICFLLNRHPEQVATRLGVGLASIVLVCGLAWGALDLYDRPVRRLLTRHFAPARRQADSRFRDEPRLWRIKTASRNGLPSGCYAASPAPLAAPEGVER